MMKAGQAEPRADRIAFALGVMVATNFTLATADAIIRSTLTEMPLSQFILLRSCITLPLLVLILKGRFPQDGLRPRAPLWALLRSALLLLTGTMILGSPASAIACQSGPPAIVSTWDFSCLAFAVLLGVVIFSEHLQLSAIPGILLIAAGGILAVRR